MNSPPGPGGDPAGLAGRKVATVELFMSHSETRTNATHWVGGSEGASLMDWTLAGDSNRRGEIWLWVGVSWGRPGTRVDHVGGKRALKRHETMKHEPASLVLSGVGPLTKKHKSWKFRQTWAKSTQFCKLIFLPLMGFSANRKVAW